MFQEFRSVHITKYGSELTGSTKYCETRITQRDFYLKDVNVFNLGKRVVAENFSLGHNGYCEEKNLDYEAIKIFESRDMR